MGTSFRAHSCQASQPVSPEIHSVTLMVFFLQICEVRLRCAFLRLRCDFLRLQCAFLRLPCAPVAYLPATTLPAFAAPAAGLLQPQRAVPDHRRARPLAFSRRLSAQSRSRRAYSAIGATSPPQAPRDGSAHSCGSTRTYGATPPRLGAAHGSNRCRPTTRLLPLPLSAMRPLRQCTPRTRRQIPLRLATVAAMRPPPALIVTTRLLRYTFLPCAGERTAAAMVEPRVG